MKNPAVCQAVALGRLAEIYGDSIGLGVGEAREERGDIPGDDEGAVKDMLMEYVENRRALELDGCARIAIELKKKGWEVMPDQMLALTFVPRGMGIHMKRKSGAKRVVGGEKLECSVAEGTLMVKEEEEDKEEKKKMKGEEENEKEGEEEEKEDEENLLDIASLSSDQVDRESIPAAEVKKNLRKHALKVSSNKGELVERLIPSFNDKDKMDVENVMETLAMENKKNCGGDKSYDKDGKKSDAEQQKEKLLPGSEKKKKKQLYYRSSRM